MSDVEHGVDRRRSHNQKDPKEENDQYTERNSSTCTWSSGSLGSPCFGRSRIVVCGRWGTVVGGTFSGGRPRADHVEVSIVPVSTHRISASEEKEGKQSCVCGVEILRYVVARKLKARDGSSSFVVRRQ